MDEHSSSKMQTWIVVLLSWAIILLMFGIGYMVYNKNEKFAAEAPITPTDLTSICTDTVRDALAAQPKAEPIVCPTGEIYKGYGNIRFEYPLDWEVFAHANEISEITTIRLSADPLWLCNGCDGPNNALNIILEKNSGAKSLDTVVAERYTSANGYSNITKGTASYNGKTAVTIKATFSGMITGPVEKILYVTPATIVTVSNHNVESNQDIENAWKTVTASLDFSAIE